MHMRVWGEGLPSLCVSVCEGSPAPAGTLPPSLPHPLPGSLLAGSSSLEDSSTEGSGALRVVGATGHMGLGSASSLAVAGSSTGPGGPGLPSHDAPGLFMSADFASLLWGFAKLGYHPGADWLHHCCRAAGTRLDVSRERGRGRGAEEGGGVGGAAEVQRRARGTGIGGVGLGGRGQRCGARWVQVDGTRGRGAEERGGGGGGLVIELVGQMRELMMWHVLRTHVLCMRSCKHTIMPECTRACVQRLMQRAPCCPLRLSRSGVPSSSAVGHVVGAGQDGPLPRPQLDAGEGKGRVCGGRGRLWAWRHRGRGRGRGGGADSVAGAD